MPFSTLKIPQEFSEESEAVFGEFQRGMGFPMTPNFMKMHGHSLAAAKGTWGLLQGAMLSGNLPPRSTGIGGHVTRPPPAFP